MAAVSSLSLETYLQLRQALTKGGKAAQPVPAFEEAFYKPTDLKQVRWQQTYLQQKHSFPAPAAP